MSQETDLLVIIVVSLVVITLLADLVMSAIGDLKTTIGTIHITHGLMCLMCTRRTPLYP